MPAEHQHITPMVPFTFMYNYRVGAYMEKYLEGLAEKKILGVRCAECGRVLLPPRSACGTCHTRPDEWVEVKPTGTLENFTIGHVAVENGEINDRPEPMIIGMVKLDGAHSLLTAKIEGIGPGDCRTGIRVQAVWREEPKGNLADLDHFEPVS